MLIVVGVIVGLAAIAWAVAAYQYAVNLREQTALTEKELDARILASREGRQLPATTLPPQSSGMGATGWLMPPKRRCCGSMTEWGASTTVDSMQLRSSRMLPGHS